MGLSVICVCTSRRLYKLAVRIHRPIRSHIRPRLSTPIVHSTPEFEPSDLHCLSGAGNEAGMVVMDLAVGGLLGANEVRRLGQESVAPSLEAACGSSWEIDNDAR